MNGNPPATPPDAALEAEVLEVWRHALRNERLTVDDDFFASGGDSLLATRMLAEVGQILGRPLPPAILFETGTLRQFLKRAATAEERTAPVSVLAGAADGRPVHFFHGDYDHGGVSALTFLQLLGPGYRVHAISPHLPHENPLPVTIEEMAGERVHAVLAQQAEGPYVLVGHCNGALVAFEVARCLAAAGRDVKAVVMVDPAIVSVKRSSRIVLAAADVVLRAAGAGAERRRSCRIWIWKRLVKADRRTKDLWPRLRTAWQGRAQVAAPPPEGAPSPPGGRYGREFQRHYLNAFAEYRPRPLDVPVLYISLKYPGRAWRRVAPNTTLINICRGNHTPWREEYSPYLVDQIRRFIAR